MDKKREQIIAGALRRFSHYGINKTTMNEIADDLAMSKPSLYYYFPDKSAIIFAVAEKIIGEYLAYVKSIFDKKMDYAAAMTSLIDYRYTFMKKYFMLHLGEMDNEPLKDEKLMALVQDLRVKEEELITNVLEIAKKEGKLVIKDSNIIADLFLDSLMGLRLFLHLQKCVFPDQDAFEKLYQKQKHLCEIFIKGITNQNYGAKDIK
ncbi:TetR/AcrR family transcriptional regulator [Pedobacter flavus]|uniref:TetR/AcrR family transcriptional regulator n=1 Tax=Pedobacter flavus TaxID=3113906 RepID=A0ABU7H5S7_9SPHI|nr:TetR/AcrR family transcriptional regulator [Pedobacter sp. VNH31]MEE1885916.1 TetR/AcrR family transcriptional regulator [Pedobacter sp. VNH31]